MRRFEAPKMTVQKLEPEKIIRSSGCWESFDCKSCYADVVICTGGFQCTGLDCPCLGSLNI